MPLSGRCSLPLSFIPLKFHSLFGEHIGIVTSVAISIKRLALFVAARLDAICGHQGFAVNAGYALIFLASCRGERNATVDFSDADDTEHSGGGCGETWKRFSRRDPACCVVPRERRADHELHLVEQHQRDDNEPHMPGEQQGCDRHAVDEAFL